jgi:flagellar biosynthesis protein
MSDPREPTDLAVALKYEAPAAPRVTAVGRGELARRIVETARAADVPLADNPVLAVALSQVPLGEPIPESLYKAVAEVLTFILRASGKLR